MDTNSSFWAGVLLQLLGMLQAMVNLVIWEKRQKVDKPEENKQ